MAHPVKELPVFVVSTPEFAAGGEEAPIALRVEPLLARLLAAAEAQVQAHVQQQRQEAAKARVRAQEEARPRVRYALD